MRGSGSLEFQYTSALVLERLNSLSQCCFPQQREFLGARRREDDARYTTSDSLQMLSLTLVALGKVGTERKGVGKECICQPECRSRVMHGRNGNNTIGF